MPRIARAVASEVVPLYLVGFLLFLLLASTDLISNIAGHMLRNQTPPLLALELYLNYLPTILGRILPAAVAFAVLIAFGRMAKDSELKAISAAGLRPLSLLWPLVLLGLTVAAVSFYNANVLTPQSNARFWSSWYKMFNAVLPPPNEQRYAHREGDTLFFAGTVISDANNRTRASLQNVLVQTPTATYSAANGTWNVADRTWTLNDLYEVRDGQAPVLVPGQRVFEQRDDLSEPVNPPDQLSLAQLRAQSADTGRDVRERRSARFELLRRFADPFAALGFALAAGALGLLLPNRGWAFASVVLLILGTYLVWSLMPQLVAVGAVPELLAAWLPNLVLVVFAGSLAWRLR